MCKRIIKNIFIYSSILLFMIGLLNPIQAVLADDSDNKKLLNGSFEEGQTWSNAYKQIDYNSVPAWYTTAYQNKIELFRTNTGTYIPSVTLKPTDGDYAAELNADEESTLYQIVNTQPSSVYEWGLDHGARNGTDTIALVIGPDQDNRPSKPSKGGRDQFMQMVDWLIETGQTSIKTSPGLGEQITVYSKKFGANGTFINNADNNAFSLTPNAFYSEEWHIWIIADSKGTSGENPWGSYGSNAVDDSSNGVGNIDFSKYYLYTVPAGQTKTIFGFVSVGVHESVAPAGKEKTYGNFLDNINFNIYYTLSGDSSKHGTGIVYDSNGNIIDFSSSNKTFISDGEDLKIQAIVDANDVLNGCEFIGIYITTQNINGNPEVRFIQLSGNEIEYREDLTEEEIDGKWVKEVNANGDHVYTYILKNVTSGIDLNFVFIKSPTVTYESNGGDPYVIENREHNAEESENVYSFKPVFTDEGMKFISPYTSKAANPPSDLDEETKTGWKFTGWLITGDIVDYESEDKVNASELGNLILPAEHTITCNYLADGLGNSNIQWFDIYNGAISLNSSEIIVDDQVTGVNWSTDEYAEKLYANAHKGLTMIAQWQYRQSFIPQVKDENGNYINSTAGGTVSITGTSGEADNYETIYNEDSSYKGESYFSAANEVVTAVATANEGYAFEGWFDSEGVLLSLKNEYSYTEGKGEVNKIYARFTHSVTQKFRRQLIDESNNFTQTTDDNIGTLSIYDYTDVIGNQISVIATEGDQYKFMGWYNEDGTAVASNMVSNGGKTLSYITTQDATYYARFKKAYTVNFATQYKKYNSTADDDYTFVNDPNNIYGQVSVKSIKNVSGIAAKSTATPTYGSVFVGWYDAAGELLSEELTCSVTINSSSHGKTYYAVFEQLYADLTINTVNTSIHDEDQVFIFNIKGTSPNTADINMNVTIAEDGTLNIAHLPVGTYTVTQLNDWSFRYDTASKDITLNADMTNELTFSESRAKDKWLDDNYSLNNHLAGGGN